MGGYIKPIGGEQWFDIELFDKRVNNFQNIEAVFLMGGQSAIRFILEDIEIKYDEYILMPSYLCPSILHHIKKLKIKYEFYKINKDLSIDLEDIKEKVSKLKIKAVFFIDYFGFYHGKETLEYFQVLKNHNIIIVEDAVQMLWFNRRKFMGNYVFNSYRKFLPIDGAIVLCNKFKKFNAIKNSYYDSVNLARSKKTVFEKFGIGKEDEFLSLYEKAEEEYYKAECILGIDHETKKMLAMVDSNYISDIRRRNYIYLYDELIQNNQIQIIFDKNFIEDNTILGLPILIENRDDIRRKLREFNIYCPVHWDILKEEWLEKYTDSIYVSKRIITLPIDQRYDLEDMDRVISSISNLIRS